jgi:hypothetical protein
VRYAVRKPIPVLNSDGNKVTITYKQLMPEKHKRQSVRETKTKHGRQVSLPWLHIKIRYLLCFAVRLRAASSCMTKISKTFILKVVFTTMYRLA